MLEIFSPYDLSKIGEIKKHSLKEVMNMLEIAHSLFHDRERHLKPYQRIEILNNLIDLIKQEQEALAVLIAKEGGKPLVDSTFESIRAVSGISTAIAEIHKLGGKEIPMELTPASSNRMAFTTKEPVGVVVAVSAFNHPLNLLIHQIVPAVAAGCPIIIKPASTTPMTCLRFVELLHKAGLPKEYCQVAICEPKITTALATDSRVSFFNFIGSGAVGWKLSKKLSPGTHYVLEHGGVAPAIVDEQVDISKIVPSLAKGGFYHAGQVCVSTQRIYVHKNIVEEFTKAFGEYASKLKVGDPTEKDTDIGPLILPREVDRIESWVNEAISQGAKLITGGKRLSNTTYAATVLYNPPESTTISQEEAFGPVVCLYSYEDRLEAIERANALPYTFQAAVFTDNINLAMDTVKRLSANSVMVNDHTAYRADWMPFGGRRLSGFGTGGIVDSIHDLTKDKLMIINLN